MKKIFIMGAAALMLCSYSYGAKKDYTVNGRIEGKAYDGKKVYMIDQVSRKTIDSAVVKNNVFKMHGQVADPAMVMLSCRGEERNSASSQLVLENGTIYIDMLTDSLSGTEMNNRLYKYTKSLDNERFNELLSKYYKAYAEAADENARNAAEKSYDSVDAGRTKMAVAAAEKLYSQNKDNVLGAFAMETIAESGEPTKSEMEARLADATKMVKEYPPIVKIMDRLTKLENTAVGKKFTDFDCIDYQTGKKSTLGEMINGKLALVDFWASWCGPCRKEISTNLIRLWDKYQDKVLIVGVDVWDKADRHKNAVEQMGIKYPQLRDDAKISTDIYGIEGIPHIMLIAPDGTILARNLRGDDIEAAIIKALNK